MAKQKFRIGDEVKWFSCGLTKHGRVVGIVKARQDIKKRVLGSVLGKKYDTHQSMRGLYYKNWSPYPRNHVSYLVAVQILGRRKEALYWPRVNHLSRGI